MFPSHFTGVYIEIRYCAIQKAHSVPEMKGHTENPNSSFKSYLKSGGTLKKMHVPGLCFNGRGNYKVGGLLRQLIRHEMCSSSARCCGDARSYTLSRTAWKPLSHYNTGLHCTKPYIMIIITMNIPSSLHAFTLCVSEGSSWHFLIAAFQIWQFIHY